MGREGTKSGDAKGFSKRLQAWMKLRGFEQKAPFARASGIPISTLRGWCNDERAVPETPKLLTLARNNPGLSLDWLLLGEGSPEREVSRRPQDLQRDLRQLLLNRLSEGRTVDEMKELEQYLPKGKYLLRMVTRFANEHVTTRARLFRRSVERVHRENVRRYVVLKQKPGRTEGEEKKLAWYAAAVLES